MSNSISTANESVLLDEARNEVYDIDWYDLSFGFSVRITIIDLYNSIQALSQTVSALVGATITCFESAG